MLLSALGSWGTALAIKSVLAGNTTTLYCRRQNLHKQLAEDLENKEHFTRCNITKGITI